MPQQTQQTDKDAIVKAGWVFGNFDGHAGERIYPSWRGALEGKRLAMRDVRVLNGCFFVHNPWKNTMEVDLGSDIATVEAYILKHGTVLEDGANVWD